MSVQALTCAFAVRGLSPSEKLVLLALANYANEHMQCWPSQERLSADTELSERSIWGALKALESRSLLSRVARRRSDGTRSTDIMTLHFVGMITSEPLANFAKPSRKSCETNPQILPNQLATVATQNLSVPEPSEEEPFIGDADASPTHPAPAKQTRGTRLPEDWEPSPADVAFAQAEGLSPEEIHRAAREFRNFWCARAGRDATKIRWDLTWQNRVSDIAARKRERGARVAGSPNAGPGRQGPADFADIVARRRGYAAG
jgi:hypothetical protein